MNKKRTCCVYRHYDKKGTLLYVGMTWNPQVRHVGASGRWFEQKIHGLEKA